MNHELKYTYEKGVKLLSCLEPYRYSRRFEDFDIQFCEGKDYEPSRLQKINTGFHWGGYDKYGWLVFNVNLPEDFKDELVAGFFDFGKTGMGNNSGFESLCILNGEKYQGVDQNHKEVLLPAGLLSFEMKFMMWAGLDGGGNEADISLTHQINTCRFLILDKKVDDFYYLLKALLQTLEQMDHNSTLYQNLLELVNQTYNMISLNNTQRTVSDIHEAYTVLEENLLELREDNPDIVRCLGHTHIDVAWLWTLDHTREKAQRSFATVLQLMERYPEYIFFQSQPQIYSKLKQDAPEIYKKIKEKVEEGVWEPNGGMWVEADCLLSGGESLVRQLLYGKSFFNQEFAVESNVLWLPDVFGYSAALPQILKLADIDSFMTTKISWNQYNRIPNDTFKWRGIDGSEVLTHFVTTPTLGDAGELESLDFYTYNGMVNASSVNGIWDSYSNKGLTDELLLSYGYGDGGGGVTRDMLEMVEKLDKIPGNPKITTGNAAGYFDKLQEIKDSKEMNTWDGELYLEFHRGTYTSQARTKRYNRKLEYALRNSEILAVMNGPDTYPGEFFETQWKELLTRQFHDILPGSGIREVYQEAEAAYVEIESLLEKNSKNSVKEMTASAEGCSVFNPNSFSTKETIFIPADKASVFKDDSGRVIECQKSLKGNGYFVSIDMDPLSFKQVLITAFQEDSKEDLVSDNKNEIYEVENIHYRITWNKAGKINSLFSKSKGKELVPNGKYYNDLRVFEDKPRHFDAWELEPYYMDKSESVDQLLSSKMIEDGPLLKVIEFVWKHNSSVITQYMKLYKDNRRIDFETFVDWKERNTILRTFFETDIRSTKASFDIQFGSIERTTHNNTIWDFAKFEVPAQKWADISQRGRGLALMNDCKYGYRVKDSILSMSLLKSAVAPDPIADWGNHEFCYSILPHDGDIYTSCVEMESLKLNNPIRLFEGCVKTTESLITVDQKNIMIDAVKLSEDGKAVIVRLHEYAGMDCDTVLRSSLDYKSWRIVNLLERDLSEASSSDISLSFKAYEIKTLALDLS